MPVLDGDNEDTLAARVLATEHRILPQAVADFLAGSLKTDGRRVLGRTQAEAGSRLEN